ncbi:MAG: peptide ABC transporter substrate-binding protein [Campylobacterales bacterium]|nr:peptide ABC transporter substrate-binding protein [Campylobacterales bacterium]
MKLIIFLSLAVLSLIASTLNLTISSNPSRINPILSNDSASSEISNWIFNGLFKYDKDGNIVNDLAQSYNFEDPKTLIVQLKKNILWHDGKKFTSEDVVFTYQTIKNPKIFTPVSTSFLQVVDVVALDEFTIKIQYSQPYFKALEVWMVGMLPKHILEKEDDLMTSSFNKNPIGTGPYKLEQFIPSQDIILARNNQYFQNLPKIESIRYKFVPDPTTSFYMLKQNQVDVGSLTPLQIDRQLDLEFQQNYSIFEQQSFAYTYLGFNNKIEKFKDIRIKEAIEYAIDKKQLLDILFFGHAQVCNGPFLPGTKAFNRKVQTTQQNIQKAKEILKELGYDQNNPFEFEVVTNANNSIRVNAAQIIQHQLKLANIKMKIKIMEWQAFLNTIVYPRNFEAVILGWGLSLTPDARSIWHSGSDKKGGFNFVGYSNEKVDKLIQEAETTIDKEKFGVIYQEIFKQIVEDKPYIFLYIPNSITTVNKKIKNVTHSLIGVMHDQYNWEKIEQ